MHATARTTCSTQAKPQKKGLLARLGPGLITGASDDDPSGIGTYSQAGAAYRYALLWTMLFSLPLMIAVQEISARIGRITGRGIAGNIRQFYPRWLLYPLVLLLLIANTINIGADLGAMGDATAMLIKGPQLLYTILFALACVALQVFASYPKCAAVFRWLTLAVLSYVGTLFCLHVPWRATLHGLLVPAVHFDADYLSMFVALLGTTISPYLFFWQASQETEEIKTTDQAPLRHAPEEAREQFRRIRFDTAVGMVLSNVVALCIIVAAAVTLNANGIKDIETSQQAAEALRPLAGKFAFVLFAFGIVGTGLLAVPVLAGSAAYAVGEALHIPTGLTREPKRAKGFYGVLAASTMIGLMINLPAVQQVTRITPVKALFLSAVINGVAAVPIMVVMMLMCHNKKIMGRYARISKTLKAVGWIATAVMGAAAVGMFVTIGK